MKSIQEVRDGVLVLLQRVRSKSVGRYGVERGLESVAHELHQIANALDSFAKGDHAEPMNAGTSTSKGCSFAQAMVDQRPKWDNQVIARKSKIIRADKRKKKRKFL
jgi:hypothetical protein